MIQFKKVYSNSKGNSFFMIAWFKWLYALLIADVFLIGQIPIVGGINLFQVTAILMLLTYFSMEKKL